MRDPTPKTYVVEVSRASEFPLDMLRYDESSPASEADAVLINKLCDRTGIEDLPKLVTVTLTTTARFAPHTPRWESFQARVISCSDGSIPISRDPNSETDPDALRQRAIRKLAEAVLKLRGKVHMAPAVYLTLRGSIDLAGQDPEHRVRAAGWCEGVDSVLEANPIGLLDGSDVAALRGALQLARDFLDAGDDACRQLTIGDRPTGVLHKLDMVSRKFI